MLYTGDGYIFTFPQGRRVGKFRFGQRADVAVEGICSDSHGDVFVSANKAELDSHIYEYAHGGTRPIADLSEETEVGQCSVDQTTGDLAIIAFYASAPTKIAIYAKARGTPRFYSDHQLSILSCAYDDKGNLFIAGRSAKLGSFRLAELRKGASHFTHVSLPKQPVSLQASHVQWDGTYLALTLLKTVQGKVEATLIYRVRVSGKTGTIVSVTHLNSSGTQPLSTWIEGGIVAANQTETPHDIGFWQYPSGGMPIKVIHGFSDRDLIGGLTVSVAP